MSEYRAITITQGSGGFGGPLTVEPKEGKDVLLYITCLLYTSPSPRDVEESRMPSSA